VRMCCKGCKRRNVRDGVEWGEVDGVMKSEWNGYLTHMINVFFQKSF
jgi:hypothetical protein